MSTLVTCTLIEDTNKKRALARSFNYMCITEIDATNSVVFNFCILRESDQYVFNATKLYPTLLQE